MKRTLLCTLTLIAAASVSVTDARAQPAFLTSDRTVANGNPLNSSQTGSVYVGQDSVGGLVPGVDVDVLAGTALPAFGTFVARSDSQTTVYGGNLGGGIAADGTATVRAFAGTLGAIRAEGSSRVTMEDGRAFQIQVANNGYVRVNGGLTAHPTIFTLLESQGAGSVLELAGGTTVGVARAGGGGLTRVLGGNYATLHSLSGMIEVSGGLPASGGRLAALNRGANAQGRFTFVGSNFTLTNPIAGSYSDPTYLLSTPGVFYTLRGTLADGTRIDASYFEEALTVNDQPRLLTFVSASAPEPGSLTLLLLAALPPVQRFTRRNRPVR
jgi:hypothetical protein